MNVPIGPVYKETQPTTGFTILPTSQTLLVLASPNAPAPEVIPDEWKGSTEKVMEYLQPSVKVALQTGTANRTIQETIYFRDGIEAFKPDNFIHASPTLRALKAEKIMSDQLIAMIDQNEQFRNALNDPQGRLALIAVLEQLAKELDV
jgi:hypothetical protein